MIRIVGDWTPGIKSVDVPKGNNHILANLEGPVFPRNLSVIPAPKAGPSLFSCDLPDNNADYIFTLANNHTMDYGVAGLDATLNILGQRNMQYCGAGKNVLEARKPIIVRDGKLSVGIIGCCEAQFGVARRSQAGVAEFGSWIYRSISDLRERTDAIIVSVHAGVEDSPWPSPYIRDLYRSFVDAGATLIHGHHSHVPQGYEKYRNGVIFYGMGNFAVDPDKWRTYPNGMWSLGVDIDFSSTSFRCNPITYEIRNQIGLKRILIEESSSEEFERHKIYLEICNRPLKDDDLFEALWQEIALRAYYAFGGEYMDFIGSSEPITFELLQEELKKIIRAVFKKDTNSHTDKQRLLLYYHMIACESHRQMLITALGIMSGEITDLRTDKTRRLADDMVPWPYHEK